MVFVQVPCSAVFKPTPTDNGICCSFNALLADKLYKPSKFSKSVTKLQKQSSENAFDADIPLPPWYLRSTEPFPDIGGLNCTKFWLKQSQMHNSHGRVFTQRIFSFLSYLLFNGWIVGGQWANSGQWSDSGQWVRISDADNSAEKISAQSVDKCLNWRPFCFC